MSKMEFNGVELELDLMDADVMETFEQGLAKTAENVQEKTQYVGKQNSECMRIQCGHVNHFFDSVFGAGTSEKIFGKKNNLEDHMIAFGKAANMVGQVKERTKEITSKYAPERVQNRAERRANKGKKGNKAKYMNNAAHNR